MSTPTVSVALCTHNGLPFVREQIRSVLHQTAAPVQLVLSDDASTDGTVAAVREIVARFRAEQPTTSIQLTILENKAPLGVTANFQQAVLACTGELVALCDQDDVWVPNRLQRMAEEFSGRENLALLHTDARLVDGEGAPIGHTLFEAIGLTASERRRERAGDGLAVLLQRNVVTGATAVFRRSLLESASPFPASWVHDEWLAMIAALTAQLDLLTEPLIDYRQHGTNEIGAAKPTIADRLDRLRMSRGERNRRLLDRARALADRAAALDGIAEPTLELLRGKVRHEEARSALPAARVLRILPVLRELASGRYHRFGRARFDVFRDLLQSP